MMPATSFTEAMISSIVAPACRASTVPLCTFSLESSINCLISLAASAERCARLRTSVATTAKPRPASPARAASTAALSASRLVCEAMPLMMPTMSEILTEDSLMSLMVETILPMMAPPLSAVPSALRATSVPRVE